MSNRLAILEKSLEKKTAALDQKFETHFDTVKQANGQPLNDKRNGRSTLDLWERQSDGIRNQKASIERTERAIEIEKGKIANVEAAKTKLPDAILALTEAKELIQWRKHPLFFFVPGVDKARIIYDAKSNRIAHRYLSAITDKEQYSKFAKLFNQLNRTLAEND